MLSKDQSIPVVYARGGTSKALFFHEHDLPAPGLARDRLLRRLMGSPDPMQIDGMGGSHVVTSKAAIIARSTREDADVDYTFVQVGIDDGFVGYAGNCGNISAAVGPFAVDEGLLKQDRPGVSPDSQVKAKEVRIYNTGTKKLLISHVPIDQNSGKALEAGDYEIAGCPGTGAPILMDYRNVLGATLGRGVLPTKNARDNTVIQGHPISFTICDVGNIIIFAAAKDFGVSGNETPGKLDRDHVFIGKVKELRGKAAQIVGMCEDWSKVDTESPMVPMVVLLSHSDISNAHLQVRLFLDNRCHTSMAGTGAICTAACSRIPGTVFTEFMKSESLSESAINIQHPAGVMPIIVEMGQRSPSSAEEITFKSLSFIRTARRLLDGRIYIPNDVKDCLPSPWLLQATEDAVTYGAPDGRKSCPSKEVNSGSVNGFEKGIITNGTSHRDPRTPLELDATNPDAGPTTTKDFARFIYDLNYQDFQDEQIAKIRLLLLDYIGVTASATVSADSTPSILKAVEALAGSADGRCTVLAYNRSFPQPYAALLNGSFAHSLDFDDTHAGGALHPGASILSVALAEAEANQAVTSFDLFVAIAAGYEVTCRLGVALGIGGYERGFHNTSTAGCFGAVATIAKLRKFSTSAIENALGLALSKAAGTMQYLANGSWNKRLHPGFAAHDAFICAALAEAGVTGAAESIEGKFGLLNLYSASPAAMTKSKPFFRHWEFMETSIKLYPACRMTHGQIELAAMMSQDNSHHAIKQITVSMAKECFPIVGEDKAAKVHPKNIVDAQFSTYYQTAVAWLYGIPMGFSVYDKITDAATHELCEKIVVRIDNSYRGLETSLSIDWEDGTRTSEKLKNPIGEADNPITWEAARAKFLGLATAVYGDKKSLRICELVGSLEKSSIRDLMVIIK